MAQTHSEDAGVYQPGLATELTSLETSQLHVPYSPPAYDSDVLAPAF